MIPTHELEALKRAAAHQAGPLAEALLGQRNRHASTRTRWHFGRGQGSLWVHTAGPRAGRWHDGATQLGGDMLDLVLQERGGTFPEAVTWLRDCLGLAAEQQLPPAPAQAREPRQRDLTDEIRWRRERARRIWDETVAGDAPGSLVPTYLRSRGLHFEPELGLRFHPQCPRGWDKERQAPVEVLPAMVARMIDPTTGEPVGIHRTYLRPDGLGKADGEPKKAMLGRSGVIALAPPEYVSEALGLAEGIETALGVMQLAGWRPVWAAGSAGGIGKLPVLPGIEALTIFADPGEAGEQAADECAARWAEAGREVVISLPPEDVGGDWLDTLAPQQRAEESAR